MNKFYLRPGSDPCHPVNQIISWCNGIFNRWPIYLPQIIYCFQFVLLYLVMSLLLFVDIRPITYKCILRLRRDTHSKVGCKNSCDWSHSVSKISQVNYIERSFFLSNIQLLLIPITCNPTLPFINYQCALSVKLTQMLPTWLKLTLIVRAWRVWFFKASFVTPGNRIKTGY